MATASRITPESLSHRTVVALNGDGILSFLHNILTCDVEDLIQGQIAYGALLSPQGKILHDMFIHHEGEAVLVDCDEDQRDGLIAKLKLYRLRAKRHIRLRVLRQWCIEQLDLMRRASITRCQRPRPERVVIERGVTPVRQ